MKTLVLNCGSSSLKFQLIDTDNGKLLAKGLVEKIGTASSILTYKSFNNNDICEIMEIKNHDYALQLTLNTLTDKTRGVISDISEIEAIGHRVVHGGEKFSGSVLINDEVINSIKECSIFAPLHNPPNLMGIEACCELINGINQVAVFDTAFHQQLPKYAYLYGLPYAFYDKFRIKKIWIPWHISLVCFKKSSRSLGKDYNNFKVIVCHFRQWRKCFRG